MKQSAPNTWLYGGILERAEWRVRPGTIQFWDGEEAEVRPGDTVTMLVTGGSVRFVEVERAERPRA